MLTMYRCYFHNSTISELWEEEGFTGLYMVEQVWADNEPGTAVPEGDYELVPHNGPKYGPSVAMVNEELGVSANDERAAGIPRFACLMGHVANVPTEIEGCACPGSGIGTFNNYKGFTGVGVTNSGDAMKSLKKILPKHEELRIMSKNE